MRILLVSARYLPHRGGLETVVFHLAREYQRLGHAVRIVTNRYPRTLPAREVIDGVPVTRLHFLLPSASYLRHRRADLWLAGVWFRFASVRALRRIIRDFHPDIINNHYLNEVAEFTARALAGVVHPTPWVISLHGGDVDGEPHGSPARRQRFSHLTGQTDAVTACSGFLSAQAAELEPSLSGQIIVIHNGVDVRRFAAAAPLTSGVPYIFAVGQLQSHKGFDLLVNAFARVAAAHPQAQLWLAGDGPQRTELQGLVQSLGLCAQVRLLGKVDESEVASLMAGSLFVAMPSRREPFGIVALEALAAGKPLLASPVGGLPEFVPVPPNRLVVPQLEAWVAALDEWLALALQGQLAAPCNELAAQGYDWSVVAGRYLQVYAQAIAHA